MQIGTIRAVGQAHHYQAILAFGMDRYGHTAENIPSLSLVILHTNAGPKIVGG